jgi:hypothetical protein
MEGNKVNSVAADSIARDAIEFGAHVDERFSGWRLGFLAGAYFYDGTHKPVEKKTSNSSLGNSTEPTTPRTGGAEGMLGVEQREADSHKKPPSEAIPLNHANAPSRTQSEPRCVGSGKTHGSRSEGVSSCAPADVALVAATNPAELAMGQTTCLVRCQRRM